MNTIVKAMLGIFVVTHGIGIVEPVAAQNYPNKPIRLIAPVAVGGQQDIVARMLAQKLSDAFRQSIVVDNRPGGGATIGTETAVRAERELNV